MCNRHEAGNDWVRLKQDHCHYEKQDSCHFEKVDMYWYVAVAAAYAAAVAVDEAGLFWGILDLTLTGIWVRKSNLWKGRHWMRKILRLGNGLDFVVVDGGVDIVVFVDLVGNG